MNPNRRTAVRSVLFPAVVLSAVSALSAVHPSRAAAQGGKEQVARYLDAQQARFANVAHQIWTFAEVGYQEEKSSALLQQQLKDAGFDIESGVAGMPTAARRAQNALQALNDKLYRLEERPVQYRARAGQDLIAWRTGVDSKLARLVTFTSMADAPPTQGQRELLGRLIQVIQQHADAVSQVEKKEFAAIRSMARSQR